MAGGNSSIIIIKRPRKAAHGHHGGAWKVAYADFVTAMMAFFLLLWLLNAASEEQLIGISNYFAPVAIPGKSGGATGMLTGRTIAAQVELRDADSEPTDMTGPEATMAAMLARISDPEDAEDEPTQEELDARLVEREDEQFRAAERQLREAIDGAPGLRALADHLLISQSPEGLNIQIVDREGLPMFPRGSAAMHAHTQELLKLVARVVDHMPQDVAITGHTDATPFATDTGYSNWELSADRANAARRSLVDFGVPPARISRVVGKAATEPLRVDDPKAPANRRLSVILLRGTGTDTPPDAMPGTLPDTLPGTMPR